MSWILSKLPNEDSYEAVIFDCDGTLVDNMPVHFEAWTLALAEQGFGPEFFTEELFYAWAGHPTPSIVEQLNAKYGVNVDLAILRGRRKELFLDNLVTATLIEPVIEIVKDCIDKGIPIAVASGGSYEAVSKTLIGFNMLDWFGAIVTADDVVKGKPNPEVFLKAAEQLDIAPEKCLVFEDAIAGVQAAQAAGMQFVTVSK